MKFVLLICCMFIYGFAAPAFNKERVFKNSDGTSFKARAFGDHHLNWIQTSDGEVLKFNYTTKDFEYAIIKDDNLKPSGEKYNKADSNKSKALKRVERLRLEDVYKLWKKRAKH